MQQKTKRRIIIAAIILLLLCLIACLTLCDRDDKSEHKRAPSKTIVGAEEETEKTEPAPEEDVKTDEEQPDHEQPAKETVAQSQSGKEPAAGSSANNSEPAGKPSLGSSSASEPSTSPGSTTDTPKEKVWVVDKAAWTEQQPIWAPTWWVEYQDGYVYTTFSEAEAFNLYGTKDSTHGIAHSWGTGEDQIKGYKTINHPEEGHWEYR